MKDKLLFPFRLAIWEFKKDNAFRKTGQRKKVKWTMFGFMQQSLMFLFMISVMYAYLVWIIIGSIVGSMFYSVSIVDVLTIMIAFIALSLMTWAFVSIFKNIFPKPKINFLKKEGLYEQYQEVTKNI